MFTPPLVPHHSEHGYGFWHVNDEQEMVMNLKVSEKRIVTVLVEGFPKRGRHDRFAWYCLQRPTRSICARSKPAASGFRALMPSRTMPSKTFNSDVDLRTCSECGTVHPIAYSDFPRTTRPRRR